MDRRKKKKNKIKTVNRNRIDRVGRLLYGACCVCCGAAQCTVMLVHVRVSINSQFDRMPDSIDHRTISNKLSGF